MSFKEENESCHGKHDGEESQGLLKQFQWHIGIARSQILLRLSDQDNSSALCKSGQF